MQTIALDLMGGDRAPDAVAQGAWEAVRELDVHIVLIGPGDVLRSQMARARELAARVTPFETSQVVEMSESPTDAWRDKKDSSIAVGVRMVKDGQADAFVSAGNTGAIAAASLFTLDTLEGIDRPAIATLYMNAAGGLSLILDIGANVDCRPAFMVQFAHLGSDFMERVFKVRRPRVALLSNGEEDSKGTKLVKESNRLLRNSDLNFIGNIDGFDIYSGVADVVVTDGFTGNVVLKLAEGITRSIIGSLRDAMASSILARASKLTWGPSLRSALRRWDYSTIGGAPLLGVNGTVIMAHGRSNARDICNAVTLAARVAREGGWRPPAPVANLEAAPRI